MASIQKNIEKLNQMFAENFTPETVFSQFEYLTNPERGIHISEEKLNEAIHGGTVGELLCKYDVIAFNQTVQDLNF